MAISGQPFIQRIKSFNFNMVFSKKSCLTKSGSFYIYVIKLDMKNKAALSLLLIIFTLHFSKAQETAKYITQRNNFNNLSDGVGYYDYIYKTPPEIPGVNGSPYLFDKWSEATIQVKDNDNEYHVKAVKYDVLNNRLEFNYDPEIKVLNGSKVNRFDILNNLSGKTESYVNCSEVIKSEKLIGFCKVLAEGKLNLVVRKTAIMKNPTYNATLMVGTKEKEIIMTDEYYLSDNQITQKVKSKGDVKGFFKKLDFNISEYKKASPKDSVELIRLVNHYNQTFK
jgi:hypothetical protein